MYEDIQRAPLLAYLIEQPIQVLELAHIGLDEHHSAAELLRFVNHSLGRLPIAEEVQDNICAPFRKVKRNSASYSPP